MSYSQVKGVIGKVASVAYLTTGSSLKMHNMELNDLAAPSDCRYPNSGVIVGQLASLIHISHSSFSNNNCTYVYSDRTPVEIQHSTLTNGLLNSYVNVVGSALLIENSVFANSTKKSTAFGRGVKCVSCTQVSISESTFENLYGQKGGAIYIDKSYQGQLY